MDGDFAWYQLLLELVIIRVILQKLSIFRKQNNINITSTGPPPFLSAPKKFFSHLNSAIVSILLALKLDQLIWADERGRCNDKMILRMWVHNKVLSGRKCGSFYLASKIRIQHWVQGTLCFMSHGSDTFAEICWSRPFEYFRLPALQLNPGPPVQQVNDLTTRPPNSLLILISHSLFASCHI